MSYRLISTEPAALHAYLMLSHSLHIFLDCEGENLGCEGGALRLISFKSGTMGAQHVLFDVTAIPFIARAWLSRILRNPGIQKIVWDGRLDCVELRRTYGFELRSVLDLQLADITSRAVRGVSDQSRKYDRWHPLYPARFLDTEGVYCLSSRKRVLDEHGAQRSSSPRNSNDRISHNRWMERPLPQEYLTYAAGDIYARIERVSSFQSHSYPKPELEVQSAQYVNMHAGRPVEQGNIYQSYNLCPLDILAVPAGPTSQCNKCRRMLSQGCFMYRDGPVRWPRDDDRACQLQGVLPSGRSRGRERRSLREHALAACVHSDIQGLGERHAFPEPADDFYPDYDEDTPYDYINADSYPDDQADDYRRASYRRDSEYS